MQLFQSAKEEVEGNRGHACDPFSTRFHHRLWMFFANRFATRSWSTTSSK
jgi:hypothetical protein